MKVHHEDRVFWGVLSAATFCAFLFVLAVATTPWTTAGKFLTYGIIALIYCGVMIPTFIFFFETRDKRINEEGENQRRAEHEAAEVRKRQLEVTQLEAGEKPDEPGVTTAHRGRGRRM